MIAIGVLFSKNTKSTEDFYLGGRKMGPLVTAMSAEASDMSSWLLMGLPGLAYLSGICDPGWTALGLVIGTWLNWFFVSKRLRRYSCRNAQRWHYGICMEICDPSIRWGWNIYELLPAFVVSMVMIVTVSLVTEAPAKDILQEYDLVVKGDQMEEEAASYETGSSV